MDPLHALSASDTAERPPARETHLRLVGQSEAPPPNRLPIDPAIVQRAVAGDDTAFTELVRWYHPRFMHFAQHMLRSDADADDVVQDAFLRIHRALPSYEDRDRFESWLFRILANCCRTLLRKNRRLSVRFIGLNTPEARAVHTRSGTRDEAALRTLLAAALDTLPVEQREAFLLYHIDGHSYESMSEITGLGQSALKMRVKRACDRLHVRLSEASHG